MSALRAKVIAALVAFSPVSHAQSARDFSAAQAEAVKFLGELVKSDTSNPRGNK